jgi:hypothetical protein
MITQQLIDNEHCCSGIHVTGEKRIRYLIHIELVSTSVPALFIYLICQFIYKQKIVVKLVVSVKTVGQVQQPGQIFIACPGFGIGKIGIDRIGIESFIYTGRMGIIGFIGY